ncbi:Hypothetical predicted protein [Mytilus galloprovincialis]|nr:Hypothetical predicted protein [Mytilus galloprovincialis]
MLSKKLKTRKSWEDQKPLVMAEILKLKFLQCKAFRDRLTSTSGYINHNVPDEFWGTGRKGKGKKRIECVIGSKPRDVKHTTKSESLLLQTYGQAMPDPINTGSFRSVRDEVSTGILRRYHPVVLEELFSWTVYSEPFCATGKYSGKYRTDVEPEVVTVGDNSDVEPDSDMDAEPVADIIDADLAFDMNSSTTRSDNVVDENLCPFIDASDSQNIHPLSNGCLQSSFLETNEVIDLLSTFTESRITRWHTQGTKNDVFFMIRNGKNITNRSNGKRSEFSDDCGKRVYVPIEPQPSQESVFELSKSYATLKKDSNYKKRVSWLAQGAKESVAVAEYLGQFPGLAPHGNSKSGEEYFRTPASVMTEMSDMLRKDRPLNVYNKLTNKSEVTSGPSNRKQVHDKNYNDKKKQRIQDLGHFVSRGNMLTTINEIDKMLAGDKDTIVDLYKKKGRPA